MCVCVCVYVYIYFLFFIFFDRVACGILVPGPGIEPMPPAVEAWNLNHWTAKEVPEMSPFFTLGFQHCGFDILI